MRFLLLFSLFLCLIDFAESKKLKPSEAEVTHKVMLEVEINGKRSRGISLGLFGKNVPRTVDNFLQLCLGSKKDENGANMSYNNCPFHRIIPGFMIQGGDFTHHNGTGGRSIYGNKFDDENFDIRHERGVISMANAGPNTNGSQFFITTDKTSWLDGKHVVFGRVIEGYDVVTKIEEQGSPSGKPKNQVIIVNCHRLKD